MRLLLVLSVAANILFGQVTLDGWRLANHKPCQHQPADYLTGKVLIPCTITDPLWRSEL